MNQFQTCSSPDCWLGLWVSDAALGFTMQLKYCIVEIENKMRRCWWGTLSQNFPWKFIERDSNLDFTTWESELIDIIIQICTTDFLKAYYLSKYCLSQSTLLSKISVLIKYSTKNISLIKPPTLPAHWLIFFSEWAIMYISS